MKKKPEHMGVTALKVGFVLAAAMGAYAQLTKPRTHAAPNAADAPVEVIKTADGMTINVMQ